MKTSHSQGSPFSNLISRDKYLFSVIGAVISFNNVYAKLLILDLVSLCERTRNTSQVMKYLISIVKSWTVISYKNTKWSNTSDISIRDTMYECTSYIVSQGYTLLKLSAYRKQGKWDSSYSDFDWLQTENTYSRQIRNRRKRNRRTRNRRIRNRRPRNRQTRNRRIRNRWTRNRRIRNRRTRNRRIRNRRTRNRRIRNRRTRNRRTRNRRIRNRWIRNRRNAKTPIINRVTFTEGAVHKVCHAFLMIFDPPLSQTVTNLGPPQKYVTLLGPPPPSESDNIICENNRWLWEIFKTVL